MSKIRSKKIRNLAITETTDTKSSFLHGKLKYILLWLTISIGFGAYYANKIGLLRELNEQYHHQYIALKYGSSNYCQQPFKAEQMLRHLRSELFNQNDAIDALQEIFEHVNDDLTSIALIGTSGIGKSLTGKIIHAEWQWPHARYQHLWIRGIATFVQLNQFVQDFAMFSSCGWNLFIIDGIPLRQLQGIKEFNGNLKYFTKDNGLKVIVIYIFNLYQFGDDAIEDAEQINADVKSLMKEEIHPIRFRTFNQTEVKQCIQAEAIRLNVRLTEDQQTSILRSIQVEQSGCKLISTKIALFL